MLAVKNWRLKAFENEIVAEKSTTDRIAYRNHISIKEMIRGDYVYPEPLFVDEVDSAVQYLLPNNNLQPSKFSLIVTSQKATIYALPRSKLNFIPTKMKKMLVIGLYEWRVPAEDTRVIEEQERAWKKYQ